MIKNACPKPSSLTEIDPNACNLVFKKDARFLFQRLDDANNLFADATNDISLASSWSALPDASDDTKVIVTPHLHDVNWSEPDKLENGETIEGAPYYVGQNPQLVRAMMKNVPMATYSALKDLEAERTDLTFYRVDTGGLIRARKIGDDHAGIKIIDNTFCVKTPFRAGSSADIIEDCVIEFYVDADYFKDVETVQPESGFNPLTAIKPTA